MGIQTEKHMGRNQLIERLSAQVGNRDMAVSILQDRGMLLPGTETLTKKRHDEKFDDCGGTSY